MTPQEKADFKNELVTELRRTATPDGAPQTPPTPAFDAALWKDSLRKECVDKIKADYWLIPRSWWVAAGIAATVFSAIVGLLGTLGVIRSDAKKQLTDRIVALVAANGPCDRIEAMDKHLSAPNPVAEFALLKTDRDAASDHLKHLDSDVSRLKLDRDTTLSRTDRLIRDREWLYAQLSESAHWTEASLNLSLGLKTYVSDLIHTSLPGKTVGFDASFRPYDDFNRSLNSWLASVQKVAKSPPDDRP